MVSRKALRIFWEQNPETKNALDRWFKIMSRTDFDSLVDVRTVFPSADSVGELTVFNVGGNRCRLITSIHFNRRKVYIRRVLTHEEYNRGSWKG